MSLWDNIRKRRASGKPKLKPGDKNYPKTLDIGEADKRIPRKKGQPAKSDKHSDLYTDENPVGTIKGLKFATVDDAEKSVKKIDNSGKTHAHKIQAAIAMEQRARVMGKKAEAAVYRKYIEKMKKITKKRQKMKENNRGFQPAMMLHEPTKKKILAKQSKNRKKKNEDAPATNTSSIPNPALTAMGPRFTTTNVMDRRKKKKPDVLKRFKQHMMDSA